MEALKEESPEVDFSKQLWKCPKCVEYVDNVLPVFLLTFRVMDETGETKFLLFDKLAMAVVNQTTAELVDNLDEVTYVGKHLFKVSIEKCNTIYNSDTFKLLKIVTQSDIVREFSDVG
uniref:Replication factor A C-terminal domain-containing protein n=1 Tax=Noccaea caerulescens TaxID=107243 RepID=A0A1J3FS16_NOCCA